MLPTESLGSRIRRLRRELAALEQQQHADLRRLIATAFPGEVFSALQIAQHPELRTAFSDAGLHSPQQIGKWLQRECGEGVERICRDGNGIVWSVSADNLHDAAGIVLDDDI